MDTKTKKRIEEMQIRFLICLNEPANPYTSALSEKTIQALSKQYDVVVNEFKEIDIQEESTTCRSRVAISGKKLAEQIRMIFNWHNLQYKELAPDTYSWQCGKIGLEVFHDAKTIVSVLKTPRTKIIFYDGPSGHAQ